MATMTDPVQVPTSPEIVGIDLQMPGETVQEVEKIGREMRRSPGDVLALGASVLALLLTIRNRKGRLIAEYPDGTRTVVELPK